MKKLTNIFGSVSVLDFKGEILQRTTANVSNTAASQADEWHSLSLTTGLHFPTTRIRSASSSTCCLWWGLSFKMPVTSTAEPKVSNLKWREREREKKKLSLHSHQKLSGQVSPTLAGIKSKCLRVVQLWTGNYLQGLQRAAVVQVKEEVLLLRSDRANPSLPQKATNCLASYSFRAKSLLQNVCFLSILTTALQCNNRLICPPLLLIVFKVHS